MAWENGLRIPAALAAADLSSNQFYCVKKNATDNQFALCTVDGEIVEGILQNKPDAAGDAAEVIYFGVSKGEAGETLTAGDKVGTDSAGKLKIVEHTNTGADVGDYILGYVLEGAGSGELATIMITHIGRVESA